MMEKKQKRHMMQISVEAYEKIRETAFKNRRKMIQELDVMLNIKRK